jgi:hypothetical protein
LLDTTIIIIAIYSPFSCAYFFIFLFRHDEEGRMKMKIKEKCRNDYVSKWQLCLSFFFTFSPTVHPYRAVCLLLKIFISHFVMLWWCYFFWIEIWDLKPEFISTETREEWTLRRLN